MGSGGDKSWARGVVWDGWKATEKRLLQRDLGNGALRPWVSGGDRDGRGRGSRCGESRVTWLDRWSHVRLAQKERVRYRRGRRFIVSQRTVSEDIAGRRWATRALYPRSASPVHALVWF